MANEDSIQDMEVEWKDFSVKFHADSENTKQRIHKVNKNDYLM
jgi:hypothetical protein